MSYQFEQLGIGFIFTEGPVWHPTGHFLLFTDIPGDTIRRWSPAGITIYRKPSNKANGLTYDRQGRLLACEHATSRVTRTEFDGRIVVLATHYRGKELNSPNDTVVRRDGGIYFTDPPYGRGSDKFGVKREQQLDFQGVYRVGPDPGSPELLVDDFDRPNGLCFSLDESRLFVNDTARKHIRVFDVTPEGTLRNGRLWAETRGDKPGAPDGMKIDSAGNLYCTGPGGIHVFDPEGTLTEIIETPELPANLAWGDPDLKSLFIAATTSLYRIRLRVPGRPVL